MIDLFRGWPVRSVATTVRLAAVVCLFFAATCGRSAEGIAPEPSETVRQIKVLPDQAPDCTSLKTIADSVTRGCKTNDQKAIAIYNFMQLSHYHRAYPNEPGGLPVLKEINVYGWSLCGGLHSEQSALWRELGWDWRFVGWDGHTTVEANYDGRWHYLDVFLKFYAWMPDSTAPGGRTIAGEDDLNRDPDTLIRKAFTLDSARRCVYANADSPASGGDSVNWRAPSFLGCGDELEGVISGLKTHHGRDRAPGWSGIDHATGKYSADVSLAAGFSLTNSWDPKEAAWFWADNNVAPGHTCPAYKDTRNDPGVGLVLEPYIKSKPARSYANGELRFDPDFSTDRVLKSFVSAKNVKHSKKSLIPIDDSKTAVVEFQLSSPYVLTKASGSATHEPELAEVSIDDGRSFKQIDFRDFSDSVKGHLSALVRLTFRQSLAHLRVQAVVQNNPGALPYLSPGKNIVNVSVADPKALGDNKLVVTYAYQLGSRSKSSEQLVEKDEEIARQLHANWQDATTYAQKTFAAKDLPATFEIDCPTPKGQYPVYPRMLFVRREVLSPTSSPLPLPSGAVAAVVHPNEELASLPNPFLIGTEPPPAGKPRQTKTMRISLGDSEYISSKIEAGNSGILRWPKNAGEAASVVPSAVIVDGQLANLPSKKKIVAARLCVPIGAAHDKAAAQLGAALLKKPLEKASPLDINSLNDIAGMVVLPKQPTDAAEYKPAKIFAIDVTRAIKGIASGEEKFHGFALRIVPNRSVDDGWTVRCRVAPNDKVYLELDVDRD